MRKRIVNLILALSMFFTATFISPVSHEVFSQGIDTDFEQLEENHEIEPATLEDDIVEDATETDSTDSTDEAEEEVLEEVIIEETPLEEELTEGEEKQEETEEIIEEESSAETTKESETKETVEEEVEENVEEVEAPAIARTAATRQTDRFTPPVNSLNGPSIAGKFNQPEQAHIVNQSQASQNMMILTDRTEEIRTARWANRQVDLNNDFTMEMYVYMNDHNKTGLSGDGLTFTMHNDSRGKEAVGADKGGLGVYDTITRDAWVERDKIGLRHGIAIEFDMFDNIQRRTRIIRIFLDDIYNTHEYVSNWNYDGYLRTLSGDAHWGDGNRHTAFVRLSEYEENGRTRNSGYPDRMIHHETKPIWHPHSNQWRKLTVNWEKNANNTTGTLSYSFVENPVTGETINNEHIVQNFDAVFGTTPANRKVWWGVTAGSGTDNYWERPEKATMDSAVAFESIPQETVKMKRLVRNETRNPDGAFAKEVDAYPGDRLTIRYELNNPKINGVFDGWKNISVKDNNLGPFDSAVGEFLVEEDINYTFKDDHIMNVDQEVVVVNSDESDILGTYTLNPATATGNIGDTKDETTATSNDVTITVLSKPEVSFSQKIENLTYPDGYVNDSETVDAMAGDKIVFTAELKFNDTSLNFPKDDYYSIKLPEELLDNITSVTIERSGLIEETQYSIDKANRTLTIENVDVGTLANSIKITSTVGKVTQAFTENIITATYNAENGYVLGEENLTISFIPEGGLSFEVADLDFGTQEISSQHKRYKRVGEEPLIRIELPVRSTQEFKVTASYDHPILPGTTIEKKNGQEFQEFTEIDFPAEFKKTDNEYTWNPEELYLSVPAGRALDGLHTTKMTWTLQNTPGNE